jgi:hypothetical protein
LGIGVGIGVVIVGGVVVIVGGVVVIVAVICADADFLANPRKGKLAAPTAVTRSSCRRVRTCCGFFMGRSYG